MSEAACLFLYSMAVLVAAPPLLQVLTRPGHAPRFGVAAWLTAIGTVVAIWLVVTAAVVLEVAGRWNYPRALAMSCLAQLRGAIVALGDSAGLSSHVTLGAVVVAAAIGSVLAIARSARTVARLRARAHEHAEAVRLVGQRTNDPDVVIVEASQRAAYCVSGPPSTIVVTSAAVAALDDDELAAVLAHERAHLAGHHALIVTTLRGLAAVFPMLTLIREGLSQVSRLLEMCADDDSARRYGATTLLSGLTALCGPSPIGALAVADLAVRERAERLAMPPTDSVIARARVALAGAVVFLAAGPFLTLTLAASGALLCRT